MAIALRQVVGLGLSLHLFPQGCVDYAIQCSVMVYVFSAAPQFAVGNLKLLQLLLSTMVCIYGYDRMIFTSVCIRRYVKSEIISKRKAKALLMYKYRVLT